MNRLFQSPILSLCATTWLAVLSTACGARSTDATDTKTNWLTHCEEDDECSDGLSCLCGVCSKACEESEECLTLEARARCFEVSHCGAADGVCALNESTLFESSSPTAPTEAPSSGGENSAISAAQPASSTSENGEVTGPQPTCRDEADYVALGKECERIDYDCLEGTRHFTDDCGCGCEPLPECEPNRDYVVYGSCEGIDYMCEAGEIGFTDQCGCGCEPNSACDPDRAYVAYGETCNVIDFICEQNDQQFSDECGCGCEPRNPACTADPSTYVASGDACDVADIGCSTATQWFEDACGCGCELRPECSPDVEYIDDNPSCDEYAACNSGEVLAKDVCGCFCAPDPSCSDPNRNYVSTDVAYCQTANVECADTDLEFLNDCGCGCWSPPAEDGGVAQECPDAPSGDAIASRVLLEKEPCISDDVSSRAVASQAELDDVAAACGVVAPTATFDGNLVYVSISTDQLWARFASAVATNDGVHLGLETDAYCGGANPPNAIVVVELSGVANNANVVTDLCIAGECSGLPVP